MKKSPLLLATTNKGKVREIIQYLAGLPLRIECLTDLDIKTRYEEKGKTFVENARGKCLFYHHQYKHLTLAEDSGLEIDCLEGAPGVFSSRFSGPAATDEKNISKVLKMMKNVPYEKRTARFVSCIVLADNGTVLKEIQESVDGFITFEKRGNHGFGYDPIFFYPPLNRTFAELLPEEKNRVSHRGRALQKLKTFLLEYFQGA